ncbi:hypothetical protein CAEBREN_01235 [Caenorhabditis brenneri]|uniref:Uncharacterized protein n=1 Tax=Caenorhabditis brenneri TaxID=135651 RepID=G0NF60_CAEBE|nr:hypothetical protein CAEBREN_01235 [Caenorhabditis brenneri]
MDIGSSGFLQTLNIESMTMDQLKECMEDFDYSLVEKPILWTIKKCRIHSTDGSTLREPTEKNRSYYRRELTYMINQIQLDNLRRIEKRLQEFLEFEQLATSIDSSFKNLMTCLGCDVNFSNDALDEIKLKCFVENFKDCTHRVKESENVKHTSTQVFRPRSSIDRGIGIRSKCWDRMLSVQEMMESVTAVENRWKTDKKNVYEILIKSGEIVNRDDKDGKKILFTWIPKVQQEDFLQENEVSSNIWNIIKGIEDASLNELRGIFDLMKAEVKKRIRSVSMKRNRRTLKDKMFGGLSKNGESRDVSNSPIENINLPIISPHPYSISQLMDSPVVPYSLMPSFNSNLSPGTFNTMTSFGNLSMASGNENNAPGFPGFDNLNNQYL